MHQQEDERPPATRAQPASLPGQRVTMTTPLLAEGHRHGQA